MPLYEYACPTCEHTFEELVFNGEAVECPQCHEPKPPHRVCTNCGYYRGRQARPVDEE